MTAAVLLVLGPNLVQVVPNDIEETAENGTTNMRDAQTNEAFISKFPS